jgi:hypothetical protein
MNGKSLCDDREDERGAVFLCLGDYGVDVQDNCLRQLAGLTKKDWKIGDVSVAGASDN